MQWFRFYSEAIGDPKMRRIARSTKTAPATVVGVWAILLSIASDSPERGRLIMGSVPATADDISDLAGVETAAILDAMLDLGMLAADDILGLYIPNWDKRQYASDTSTPRVQAWRSKNKGKGGETLQQRSSNGGGNVSETDQKQIQKQSSSTAADYPDETLEEHLAHENPEDPVDTMPAAEFRRWTREYERTQALLVASDYEGEKVRDWWKRVPFEAWTYALEQAKDNRQTGRWSYIETILKRVEQDGLPVEKQVQKAATTVVKGLSVRTIMQ